MNFQTFGTSQDKLIPPSYTVDCFNSQSLDLGYQSGNGFFSFLEFVGSSYGFLYIIYGFWTRKKF